MFQFMSRLRSRNRTGYEPIGDSIDFEVALVQAATLLDDAALKAKKSNDVRAMIDIADSWLGIAAALVVEQEQEDDEEIEETEEMAEVTRPFSVMGISSPEDRERKESAYYGNNTYWHGPQSKLGRLQ